MEDHAVSPSIGADHVDGAVGRPLGSDYFLQQIVFLDALRSLLGAVPLAMVRYVETVFADLSLYVYAARLAGVGAGSGVVRLRARTPPPPLDCARQRDKGEARAKDDVGEGAHRSARGVV